METYLIFKALHIIAIVTWFAGIFYMPRLFVYFAEANEKLEPEKTILQNQFKIMQRRLWFGITWPSSIMAPLFAGRLIIDWNVHDNLWLRIKLWLVVGLYLYHFFLHTIYRQQQRNQIKYSPFALRMINEISTLFLVSIVFLVVLKTAISVFYSLIGLLLLIIILLTGIKIYKNVREKSR